MLNLECIKCHTPLSETLKCSKCSFEILQKDKRIFEYTNCECTNSYFMHYQLNKVDPILRRLRSFESPMAVSENYILKYLKSLDINKGDRLLEVGVYSSAILHYFSLMRGTLGVGIDISPGILNRQSEASDILKSNNIYFLGDCSRLPFVDNSFEHIICLDLLEHLQKRKQSKFLKECFRVLKKNGKVVIKIPIEKDKRFSIEKVQNKYFKDSYERKMQKLGHISENALSLSEFKKMLTDTGFEILRSDNMSFFLDYIYDNYFLPFKDKLLFNIPNRIFAVGIQESKLFYKKGLYIVLRILYYVVKLFTFIDWYFCKLGYGVNFICLAKKLSNR